MKGNLFLVLLAVIILLNVLYIFRFNKTEQDVDKAYKMGVYDGGLYTFYNKEGVMPSMWHRDYMLKLYKEKVGWQNDSDIDAFWRNITTRNFGMEIEPPVTPH